MALPKKISAPSSTMKQAFQPTNGKKDRDLEFCRGGCRYSVMGGSGSQGSKKPCLNLMLMISAAMSRMMNTMV